MVKVLYEKTGIEFEAATRHPKNHPTIIAWLSDASKDSWYAQALAVLKSGRQKYQEVSWRM